MGFPTKDWHDLPVQDTPVNRSALKDIEKRLSDYADATLAAEAGRAEGAEAVAKGTAEAAQEAANAAQAALNAISSTPSVAVGTASLANGERVVEPTGEHTTVGSGARYGAWSPGGRFFYTTAGNKIYVFERILSNGVNIGMLLIDELTVGTTLRGIVVSPNGKFVHCVDETTGTIFGFPRNVYSGAIELATKTEVVIKNKGGSVVAKLVHLAYDPLSEYLYAIAEEAEAGGGLYQFKIEATSKVVALAEPIPGGVTLGFCNYIICVKKNVYVAYEKGIQEFTRNEGTGALTNVALRGESGVAIGSLAISPDEASVYATAAGVTNKLFTWVRNPAEGKLESQAFKAVTGCKAVCVTGDGKTVMCINNTSNIIVGFDRRKPAATWELVPWTEITAKEFEPEAGAKRIVPNPDGVNVAVVCETAKTVQGFRRYVRTKVTSAYVAAEGESGRGIILDGQGANVKGVLSPIKQVAKTSFYIESNKPSDTGTVLWEMPTESNPAQPVENPETETFMGFTAASPPPATFVPYTAGSVFNIALATAAAAPIANSQAMVDYSLSLGVPSPGNITEEPGDKHAIYFAKSSDPLYKIEYQEPWGTNPAQGAIIHIPEAAVGAEGGSDHWMSVVQPDGKEYTFWKYQSKVLGSPGKIVASWGGVGSYIGAANGVQPTSGGVAGGFLPGAGIIRYPEIAAATLGSFHTIKHGLFVVIKNGHGPNGSFIPPAVHGDGLGPEESRVPYQGQRFALMNEAGTALMSDAEIEAVAGKAWQRATLAAMAQYGLINGDKGNSGFQYQFEASTMYTAMGQPNPWKTYGEANALPVFEGLHIYKLIEGSMTLEWWKKHLKAITCKE